MEMHQDLGSKGKRLLAVLVKEIERGRFKARKPETFISYGEALDKLEIPRRGRAGQQLQREGLMELNEWTRRHGGVPKIAGLIIDKKRKEPGWGFAPSHGHSEKDWKHWWLEETARAISFNDWRRYTGDEPASYAMPTPVHATLHERSDTPGLALPFLKQIELRNLLSFGPKSKPLALQPLNVIIGPNGSGKSNFLQALRVLRAGPTDITVPIREGGGILEWFWRGPGAEYAIEISVVVPFPGRKTDLHYHVGVGASGVRTAVFSEAVEDYPLYQRDKNRAYFYYRHLGTQSVIWEGGGHDRTKESKYWPRANEGTVLANLRDPSRYPEITYLAERFKEIAIYGNWDTKPEGVLRRPQRADLPDDALLEDGSNLAMVLSDLQHDRDRWGMLMGFLKRFYPAAESISIKPSGTTVQIFLFEKDIRDPISAYRLSDGTLRFLCLLAVLFQRSGPPVICLEEPENYLHRDALNILGELFIEASSRTQLIITTHATALVSAMTRHPESVLVCERFENGTRLQRLEPSKLEHWLDRYDLGEIWRMGGLGGNLA